MDNSDIKDKHDEYNSEPVLYCSQCLSLRVRTVDGTDYCDKCGNTEIKEADIHDWERMYGQRYGSSFLNEK